MKKIDLFPMSTEDFDKQLLTIPIKESGEEFVNIKLYATQNNISLLFTRSGEDLENTKLFFLRKLVVNQLCDAAIKAKEHGYILKVVDAYRSLNTQKKKFERRVHSFRQQYPNVSREEILQKANTYTAGIPVLAAHTAGAAVDVVLVDLQGYTIDMGCNTMHAGVEAAIDYKGFQNNILENRMLLKKIMGDAGFSNYPFEYWHWSIGDVCDTYLKKNSYAVYGTIDFNVTNNTYKQYPPDELKTYFFI